MDRVTFEQIKALCIHIEDQNLQAIRDLFKKYGGDYDRVDVLLFNSNLFPELMGYRLPARIRLTDKLPASIAGLILNPESWHNKFLKGGI